MKSYLYHKSINFPSYLNIALLQRKIREKGLNTIQYINVEADNVMIWFIEKLNTSDVELLNIAISEHSQSIPTLNTHVNLGNNVFIDNNGKVTGLKQLEIKNDGNTNYLSLIAADNFSADNYNHGIDTASSNRIITTTENGIYRQAAILSAKTSSQSGTISGITKSDDSGETWNPLFIVKQNGNIGIGTNTPSEVLHVVGNIKSTGTINNVDIYNHVTSSAAHNTVGTIVGTTDTQILTNKTLTLPTISSILNIGTLTLPISTDTLIGRDTTDILTNKTLDSNTNTITSSHLRTITGNINITSIAPTSGQVLTAIDSTTASWQNNNTILYDEITSVDSMIGNSSSYVTINTMSTTPNGGIYLVIFSSSGYTDGSNKVSNYAIFRNNSIISHSERKIDKISNISITSLYTSAIINTAGSDVISVKYYTNSNFYVYQRSMVLLKLS